MEELQRLREAQLERENLRRCSQHARGMSISQVQPAALQVGNQLISCVPQNLSQLPNDHKTSSKANHHDN